MPFCFRCCFCTPASVRTDEFNLQALLDAAIKKHTIPGMTACVVYDGTIQMKAGAGVRKFGSPDKVRPEDAFQLGSVTKPLTATLAYILAEKRILAINAKITDVFPEFIPVMRPEYREVDVGMLLSHATGMPYMPKNEPGDEYLSVSTDIRARRYAYTRDALRDPPEGPVGSTYVYGGGTIIVAAMMEKVTGRTWETLVREFVCAPLEIKTAGFGSMSEPSRVTGVWEHYIENGATISITPDARFALEPHAPAGRNVYMSAPDLALLMSAHFPYNNARPALLSRQSILAMQMRLRGLPTSRGWFIGYDGWTDYKTVVHDGDKGSSVSLFVFSPKYACGYVIMANISGDEAWKGVGDVENGIRDFLAAKTAAQTDVPAFPARIKPLSLGKPVTTSNNYYEMADYAGDKALDGNCLTRWATDEEVKSAWLAVDLGEDRIIRSILVKEEFSPRVREFFIEVKPDGAGEYRKVYNGKEIGDEAGYQSVTGKNPLCAVDVSRRGG